MLESGNLSGDGAVVFVHTGGAAALFAMDLG
jgi:D-cysteine desulfhydrase